MNPSDARPTRTPPRRTGPIRNPLNPQPASGNGRSSSHPAAPGDALRGALECAVQTAYTVIDDYMRRGYEAARNTRDYADSRGYMPDDKTQYGNLFNPWGPMMTGPMQMWMSTMQAWANAWSAFVPGGFPQQMWNMPASSAGPAAPVSVTVSTQRPAEITTTTSLNPGAEYSLLKVDSLSCEAPQPSTQAHGKSAHGVASSIQGIAISSGPGGVRIAVSVSADQPAGKYSGAIKAADGRIAGNLTVVITDLAQKPA